MTAARHPLRDIISHGGVFGIGLIISRLTSIVLLPVYTHVLTLADYGVVAILDLVNELLRLTLTTGLMSAGGRFHFEYDDEKGQSKVWWTALIALMALAACSVALLLPASGLLARVTIGAGVSNGSLLYVLMLCTFLVGTPDALFQNHLRLMKRSGLYVTLSVARLLFNATINIVLLYKFNLGVLAVVAGNLITAALSALVHFVIFRSLRGGVVWDRSLLRPMMHFGAPLMGVALLSMAMHQADRSILLAFVDLSKVGLYSFAYTIGQGINSTVLVPFSQIWAVAVFEIARTDQANRTYAMVFRYVSRALMLVMLAAALGSSAAVRFLAAPAYGPAADVIPVIALAYFFFSLDEHFRVPALVRKQTVALLPVYTTAVVLNLALNLVLVPLFGIAGAAWATVGTFAGFSYAGLRRYRQIERIEYPLGEVAMVVLGCIGAFLVFRFFVPERDTFLGIAIAAGIWLALAVPLLKTPLKMWREHR